MFQQPSQPEHECHLAPNGEHSFYETGFLACIYCELPFSRVPCTLTEARWITGRGPEGKPDGLGRGGLTERDIAWLVWVRMRTAMYGR